MGDGLMRIKNTAKLGFLQAQETADAGICGKEKEMYWRNFAGKAASVELNGQSMI